jgi:hypothetical protein
MSPSHSVTDAPRYGMYTVESQLKMTGTQLGGTTATQITAVTGSTSGLIFPSSTQTINPPGMTSMPASHIGPGTGATVGASNVTSSSTGSTALTPFKGSVKLLPHIVLTADDKIVSSVRLLKLKAEFTAIVYAVPEKLLRCPPTDDERVLIEKAKLMTATVTATDSTKSDSMMASADIEVDISEDDINGKGDDDEDTLRIERRRARRAWYTETMLTAVKLATTPSEVLTVVDLFESIVPPHLFSMSSLRKKQSFYIPGGKKSYLEMKEPSCIDTQVSCSYLAMRIYLLDRSLRYEDMKYMDPSLYGQERPYRPRVHFTPKCCIMFSCTRSLCHEDRCMPYTETVSRFNETLPNIPYSWVLGSNLPGSGIVISAQQNYFNRIGAGNTLPPRPVTATGVYYNPSTQQNGQYYNIRNQQGRFAPNMSGPTVGTHTSYVYDVNIKPPDMFDLELQQPYVPTASEILKSAWV